MRAGRWSGTILYVMFGVTFVAAKTFSLVVYNVENLFDVDGVSVYDDYQPSSYTPAHFATKLTHIAEILAHVEDGRGPDLVLLQEVELDQTPSADGWKTVAFPSQYAHLSAAELLQRNPLPRELADLPAETWLLKVLSERGLSAYTAVVGAEGRTAHENGFPRAIKCVTLTRLPVRAVRQFPTVDARNIVEVEVTVDGASLHVFNAHWKSGAGDPALEEIRVQNARVLRTRLDEILAADPQADVIIGGDFNSHHNQRQRYRDMRVTGINDTLRSQGNELALRGRNRDLYNLWFELPAEERGSDVYQGEWGTLMQIMISRGLYDYRGIQYVDNSFAAVRVAGRNVDANGTPVRWNGGGSVGSGYSDHLPIMATFRTVPDNRPDRWLALQRPSESETDSVIRRAARPQIDPTKAIQLDQLSNGADLRDGSWSGKPFLVTGTVVPDRHPRVAVRGQEYEIYGVDQVTRDALYAQREQGRFRFYGELGTFKGRWQFVVRDPSWVLPLNP